MSEISNEACACEQNMRKTYVTPSLEIFGEVAVLTASGSQQIQTETTTGSGCSGNPNRNRC
ncbi:hypothetical protein ANTHELSMS3_04682 (plasmid) [Antarctobacter heliothermus]|uniref:Uncharacterized protein n=1 Tax=Antarctobacter heliothermus TaxID=74033 RepID=A0A222EBV4_9RHOB|nr:hypothetical protein ANTHELSMS3_04682 [Antarctobacter heliothermus]